MKNLILNYKIYVLLIGGLLIPQLALSQTAAKAKYFDGRFLSAGDLRSVNIAMPGLYNPATGERSTQEDFEKPITVSKVYDHNSPLLATAYYNKTPIEEMTISIDIPARSGGQTTSYLQYKLTNVLVTSYSSSGGSDEEPLENITLSFSKCEILYSDRRPQLGFEN